MPFELPAVAGAMGASALLVRLVRSSSRLGGGAASSSAGFWRFAPAVIALRSSELSSYHGAEHISIGTYEHGEERGKEHERCGSHLIGPLLVTTALGNILAARAPIHLRGAARTIAGAGSAGGFHRDLRLDGCATPTPPSHARWPSRGTSSSTGWLRAIRLPRSSRWPRPLSASASAWSMQRTRN